MFRSASRCEASRVVVSFPFLSEPAGVMRSMALRTVLLREETADASSPRPSISTPAAVIVPFAAGRSPAGSRSGLNMHSTTSYETTPETAAFPPLPHNKRDTQCVQGPPMSPAWTARCFAPGAGGFRPALAARFCGAPVPDVTRPGLTANELSPWAVIPPIFGGFSVDTGALWVYVTG